MGKAKVTFHFGGAVEGTDDDADNPPSRALNRLLGQGQPYVRMSQCFCSSPGRQAHDAPVLRWLGSFVSSTGGRVLFFPGFDSAMTATWDYQETLKQCDKQFLVDHVTLEKDLMTWHITSPASKKHLSVGRTTPVGEGRFLWCGVSIANFSVLRLVKQVTIAEQPAPPSDGMRRLKSAMESNKNGVCTVVSFHPELTLPRAEGCPHFSFVVGPKGFADYVGDKHVFPAGSPALTKPFPAGPRFLLKLHRFSLSDDLDVQIQTAWLPQGITVPIIFTG